LLNTLLNNKVFVFRVVSLINLFKFCKLYVSQINKKKIALRIVMGP